MCIELGAALLVIDSSMHISISNGEHLEDSIKFSNSGQPWLLRCLNERK